MIAFSNEQEGLFSLLLGLREKKEVVQKVRRGFWWPLVSLKTVGSMGNVRLKFKNDSGGFVEIREDWFEVLNNF
jgi:hypothetical protein